MCSTLNLENVIFKPLQPYELLPALLNLADCHLVVQRKVQLTLFYPLSLRISWLLVVILLSLRKKTLSLVNYAKIIPVLQMC